MSGEMLIFKFIITIFIKAFKDLAQKPTSGLAHGDLDDCRLSLVALNPIQRVRVQA